ncbi:MAG: DUF3043 domain-containing protein, partial [Micrococcales bacterium]|nr:DUF3043 domain-containing protein [Micrococcales bacterium]
MLFGRDKTTPTPPTPQKVGGKGHATPSRKQAQAANRRPLVPKARAKDATTKQARAAQRAEARQQRDVEYRAMQTGDEANMPAQHRGPARRYLRDVVDCQRTLAEFFLPLALAMLLVAMVVSGPL